MSELKGFAVVDTETTGIHVGYKHRIAEIAIVHVDPDGRITDSWDTLVNPERDLGPQAIHGIRARDVRRAPRFGQIAGDVVTRLAGRVVVAHNWPFDAMHLRAEFDRLDVPTPFRPAAGLCTMRAAAEILPGAGRSLVDCCASVGIADRIWHTAAADATAAADLLGVLLRRAPRALAPSGEHRAAAQWPWPALPERLVEPVHRTPPDQIETHFLARLVDRIPRTGRPCTDAYLAMLDAALLDRLICDTEADELLDLAYEVGLHRHEVVDVHLGYLRALARAAWADTVVTEQERHDIESVAELLGFDKRTAHRVVEEERTPGDAAATPGVSVGGLRLRAGDTVVLTGEMCRDRSDLTAEARELGLRVTTAVSRRTSLVVAADPDSMSGKARSARSLGVPVVDEDCFLRALAELARR